MTLPRVGKNARYPLKCVQCGRDFLGWSKRQSFCGQVCSGVNRRLNHPRKPCAVCGAPVKDLMPGRQFCSIECRAAGATKPRPHCVVCGIKVSMGATTCRRHHHTPKRVARQRTCPVCQKVYIPHNAAPQRSAKYCSVDCYRTVQHQRPAMLLSTCTQCGAEFKRTAAAIKRVAKSFCSSRCAWTYNQRENSPNWRGGHDSNRGPYWRAVAEQMRERDGYRCRMCGKTQEANGQKLSVDHIIPWRSFDSADKANDPANLASLCRSCHGKKARAEIRWLRGDVLDMWRYQVAVAEPWKAA